LEKLKLKGDEMKAAGGMIFLVAFFITMLLTFASPNLPPGREVAEFLGIDLSNIPSSGIPTDMLLVGFFNGIIYSTTALFGFELATWMPTMLNRNKDD
jgi:hypothetical protein